MLINQQTLVLTDVYRNAFESKIKISPQWTYPLINPVDYHPLGIYCNVVYAHNVYANKVYAKMLIYHRWNKTG